MVKSILRKSKQKKVQTKRVRFNKYKKVKTIRKRLSKTKKNKKTTLSSKKRNKGKGKKGKNGNKRKQTRRKHVKNTNNKPKRILKLKMKGGSGHSMGVKVTGISNNSNPQQQYPESTNLNSSIPTPYQNGGSLWNTLGLGDVPLAKFGILNSAKNIFSSATGADKTISVSPAIHPEMSKSLVKYPTPIDIKSIHSVSKDAVFIK
jgi:hypothetical protein